MVLILHILPPKWFAIVFWIMVILLPSALGWSLFESPYGALGGLILGIIAIGCTIEYFLMSVPKKHALLVMNALKTDENGEATIRTVLSGFNILYPWEEASADGLFSPEQIIIPISATFPAKDGPEVRIRGSITVWPDITNLIPYLLAKNIVCQRVLDKVLNKISQIVATKKAKTVRNAIKKIDTQVSNFFAKGKDSPGEEHAGTEVVTELEKTYGITFGKVTIDVDYEVSYQKSLTTKARAAVLQETVDKMRKQTGGGDEAMSPSDAWANALVMEGGIKKTVSVQKLESKGFASLGELLLAVGHAIGGNKGGPSDGGKRRES